MAIVKQNESCGFVFSLYRRGLNLEGSGVLTIAVTLTGSTPGVGIDCPFNVASNAVTVQIR